MLIAMWSTKQLDDLLKAGKIRGYTSSDKKPGAKKVEPKKFSREKKWINVALHEWGMRKGIIIVKELVFDVERNFRFDWCFIVPGNPETKMAIEYEGLFSKKSRHTTKTGFTRDAEKYNLAQSLGWKVNRYTAINYRDLENDLLKL